MVKGVDSDPLSFISPEDTPSPRKTMSFKAAVESTYEQQDSSSSESFLSELSESDDIQEEVPITKMIIQNIHKEFKKIEESTDKATEKEAIDVAPDTKQEKRFTTRCEAALAEMDDEEFTKYLDFTLEKPESMRRKEVWVSSLYHAFCQKGKVANPFPLSGPLVCGFLHFLAVRCGYALNGIESIIVPCLRHIHVDKCGTEDKGVVQMMKRAIRALRSNPSVKIHGTGKQPLCSFDVAELISRIPDSLDTKHQEASLFLFALHSGARALTCANVLWGDIKRVDSSDTTTGVWRVIIILRVTKGNPNWNHPICIEGWPTRKNALDVVYYLNQLSITTHKKTLLEITQRSSGPNEFDTSQIWNMSPDAMRGRVKRRLEQCGFPAALWSFHSFRSGHICSALLAAGGDSSRRGNVLDITAVVAGWKPRGRAQRGYVKQVAEKQIVCSRLLGLGIGLAQTDSKKPPETASTQANPPSTSGILYAVSTQSAAEGYVHSPQSTEEFHLITLKPPNFSLTMYTNVLRRKFATFFPSEGCKKAIVHYRHNCFNRVLGLLGREADKKSGSYYDGIRAGRAIIRDRLMAGEDPTLLAHFMISKVYDLGLDPQIVPDPAEYCKKGRAQLDISRPLVTGRTGKTSRHRISWTSDEDELLIMTRKEGKRFSEIRGELAKWNRLSEDANQRWKVLVAKNPQLAAYRAAVGRKAKSQRKQK